ncbi:AAA family ATPase [Actinoplanes sp. NPDC026619]|uniref:helix-turn-helix transcriptional regulator n=1 Tax=Actinoplanes sp. NPDC026619 TaxID=3155798 RepID=UPI0033E6A408
MTPDPPRMLSPTFVGRAAELSMLRESMAWAQGGVAGSVLLGGEAGVGKSRLLREFAAQAAAAGATVLSGSCIDLGTGDLPYAPLIEAFRRLVRDRGVTAVRDLAGEAYDELAGLVPFLGEPATPAAAPSPSRLFAAVLRLLDCLGAEGPAVLIVEDLHWADRSTLDLLTYLTRSLGEERVLLLVSCRTSDLPPSHPLRPFLVELGMIRQVRRIELSRFDADELRSFLGGLLGGPAGFELVQLVFEMSDGNAFFAEEIAVAAALTSGPAGPSGPAVRQLPHSLRDLVLSRVELLGDDAREVLRAAATAGRRVSHRLLALVCELPGRRLVAALRECVDQHVLVTDLADDTYVFRHALARETVHQSLLPGERLHLHAQLATVLESDRALSYAQDLSLSAELAYHWFEAGDLPKALNASVRAGDDAVAVQAYAEAERQYDRVIDLWPRVSDPVGVAGVSHERILARAADAARWQGHVDRAVDRIRDALSEVDLTVQPIRAAELSERLGRYLWESGDLPGCQAAYRLARALLAPHQPSALAAKILAELAGTELITGRYSAGLALAEEAVALSRTVGAVAEEGLALNFVGLGRTLLGRPDDGVTELRRAVAIAETGGRLEDLHRAYGNLSFALESAGRLAESVTAALAGLERVRRFGVDRASGNALLLNNATSALVQLGRWTEAEKLAQDAIDRQAAAAVAVFPHVILAQIGIARGATAEAAAHLATARGLLTENPESHVAGPLYAAAAELALWQRDTAAARSAVRDGLAAIGGAEDTAQILRLCALGLRAEADEHARATDRARGATAADADSAERVRALADRATGAESGVLLPETAALSRLVRVERDRFQHTVRAGQWTEVAGCWMAIGCRYAAAYAFWREAEHALDGPPADPVEPLRRARDLADELGALPLAAEIAAVAGRGRLDLREPVAPTEAAEPDAVPFRLTPREREVLGHVCAGRSNRQIARLLGISDKTASVHVSNIIAKLGVASRGEAAAVAYRLGIVSTQEE